MTKKKIYGAISEEPTYDKNDEENNCDLIWDEKNNHNPQRILDAMLSLALLEAENTDNVSRLYALATILTPAYEYIDKNYLINSRKMVEKMRKITGKPIIICNTSQLP